MSSIAPSSKPNRAYTSQQLSNAEANLSTSSPIHNTQEDMVVDMRASFGRAAFEADVLHRIDRSILDYYEKRRRNLIPENEEKGWGYEDPRQRRVTRDRHQNIHVAQSFFEVNWGQGFTGRGLDTEYEICPLEGPKGETLADVVGTEVATSPDARRRRQAVDKGIRDGVDQYYSDPWINRDEDADTRGDTKVDNNIDLPRETQQQAPVTVSIDMQISLQDIAAQAFQVLGNTEVGSLRKTRREAELKPAGERSSVLTQIFHEEPLDHLRTPWDPSPQSTKRIGKKRDWASLDGPGDGTSYEWLGDEGNGERHGLKRLRAEEADTLGGLEYALQQASNKGSGAETSSLKRRGVVLEEFGGALARGCQEIYELNLSDNTKADKYARDVETAKTDAGSADSEPKRPCSDKDLGAIKTKARPTFHGISTQYNQDTKEIEWTPDNDEANDVVVMRVTKLEAREHEYPQDLAPRIDTRSWTREEEEDLRSWLQDYGMTEQWDEIAWCLHRYKDDCQMRYYEILMARNERAGRVSKAGLPGWVDPELGLTLEEEKHLNAEDAAKREAAMKEV